MNDVQAEPAFDRAAIRAFHFSRRSFDPATGVIELGYVLEDGSGAAPELVEAITVPGAPFVLDPARRAAVDRALGLLHALAGVSYYKAAVPPAITFAEGLAPDAATAAFLATVYEHGLGEFAYTNRLSLKGHVRFPHAAGAMPPAPALGLADRALVAIGGGKDSLVSIEALREAGVAQTVCWVGGSPLIRACAERTGLPTLALQRQLAPGLFALNRRGALNGHIPVTAVNSAILVLAALLHDHAEVVFSNERSASYGSLIPGTGEVNHQWSKGWDFERMFAAEVRRLVAPDLAYYSLLRPLSELAVAARFARSDRYDAWFSSCNRNFHLLGEKPASRWCGVCPKCHFVFLALAVFMPKPRLVGIFGRNLLDEPGQAAGFDALLEFGDHKPFECVGEGRESRAAFAALAQRPAWREDALVQRFVREVLPVLEADEALRGQLDLAQHLAPAHDHGIPPGRWEPLRAIVGA